jgi:hypothetical protein
MFSNRLVKVKSDLKMETEHMKKILDGFNSRLELSNQTTDHISLLLSKYIEIMMMNLAVSINECNNEVYVTYNDGIVFENKS